MNRLTAVLLSCFVALPAFAEVPVIANGPEPRDGVRTLELEELWRRGGDDDDLFFGLITRVQIVGDSVYALDSQLCNVYVFDAGGELVKTLFREGEGPGEIQQPRDMFVLSDGHVGAVMEFPGKVVMVDADGNPGPVLQPGAALRGEGGFWSLSSGFSYDDHVVLSGTLSQPGEPGTQNRNNFLCRFDAEGRETARYAEYDNMYDFRDFKFVEGEHLPGFWFNSAVGPGGRVYTAPDLGKYEIHVFAADGTPERVITRELEPWTRTPQERAAVHGLIDSAFSNSGIPYSIEILDDDPALSYFLRGLRARADGSVWTVSSRGVREQPAGVLCCFDVFDAEGVFTEQVRVPAPGRPTIDAVFLGDDRLVVVTGAADAFAAQWGNGARVSEGDGEETPPMEIVCYAIR